MTITITQPELRSVMEKILPEGISPCSSGVVPPEPSDYGDSYILPVHGVKPLQKRHNDVDESLSFYELPHIYTLDGVPTTASVTALAHGYERPFVADDAINSMKRSAKQTWPRLEYVKNAKPVKECELDVVDTNDFGIIMYKNGETKASLSPGTVRNQNISSYMWMLFGTRGGDTGDVDIEWYVFDRCMTDDEIKTKWAESGRLACNKGTEAHYMAELFFNGMPTRICPEIGVLVDFVKTYLIPSQILARNTEKEIVCRDADVAGSIDLIAFDARLKVFHIIDFKRSDKLQRDLRGYGKMQRPLQHLDDCKGASYALQLSIYQYILEREYSMVFGDRILLSLHPDKPFCTSVPYLKEETEYIMKKRMQLVRARASVAIHNTRMRCAMTNAPLVDAVRTSGEMIVMEKVAILRKLSYTIDVELREEFDALVAREMAHDDYQVVLDTSKCIQWRTQVPESGIRPFTLV